MDKWAQDAGKAVAEGTSGCQTAIPDGKYPGDPWFITDKNNKVIMMFAWGGDRWMHPYEVYKVQI